MKKLIFLFLLLSPVVLSSCTFPPAANTNSPTPTTQALVGNDKDEHGCIPSAGYQWCAAKEKCLRIWEEPCDQKTVSPTVNETEVIKSAIKQAIVAKHGDTANNLNITVSKIEGSYSKGGASAVGEGGGMWFAAKVNNQWLLVWDGNGIITCNDLTAYPDYPSTLIPECYDTKTDKMVKR